MPGVSRSAALRSLTGALLLSSALLVRQGAAQQVSVASARVSSTVVQRAGPFDRVLLAVEIVGLRGAAQTGRSRDQVKVTDDLGGTYTPVGIAVQSLENSNSLVPEYLQVPSARRTRPRHLFLVPPGKTHFVLHVTSHQPVSFNASVTAGPLR